MVKFSVYLNRLVFCNGFVTCVLTLIVLYSSAWCSLIADNPLFTDSQYNDKNRYNDNLTVTSLRLRGNNLSEIMPECFIQYLKETNVLDI